MQPLGKSGGQLATMLGIIARNGEQVPLYYEQWPDMPDDVLEDIWREVKDNTDVPEEYKSKCLHSVGRTWKNWKSQVKKDHYNKWETDEERLAYVPDRVVREQWEALIAYWGTEKEQEISAQNKRNRAFQEQLHRTGRTPFAEVRRKMKAKGKKTDRISVYIETRTNEDGGTLDQDTADVISELKHRRDAVPEEEQTPEFLEEVFTGVLGSDKNGRVRTYGEGVTPTTVLEVNKIREEVRAEFQSQFDAMFDARMATIRDSIRAEVLADLAKEREMRCGDGPSFIGRVPTSSSVYRPDLEDEEDLSSSRREMHRE